MLILLRRGPEKGLAQYAISKHTTCSHHITSLARTHAHPDHFCEGGQGGGVGAEEQRIRLRIKPTLGFFLSPLSAAPSPPICWEGMAIKKEARILFFGTKGQTPISST